jgi:hopene-associated glycosyltransferase HpnB
LIATLGAALGVLAWGYLLAARGGFWRSRERDERVPASAASASPSVCVVIPARDEAEAIGDNVSALLAQDYEGDFSIVVVDDHSSDDTAAIVRALAQRAPPSRVRLIAAPPLRDGWMGKLAAVDAGIREAGGVDYLLLTDADIRHARDSLRTLVVLAEQRGLVLASRMAMLRCESVAERALVPAFVFFFQMLYPFAWVNDPRRATAAAAGGCMLVRRDALERAGGIAAIRGALIDDCALARLVKPRGPIHLALSGRAVSVRRYGAFRDIRGMIVRSAYTELRQSPARLAFVAVSMLIVFVAPPLFALLGSGVARALGFVAWAAMALAFVPMLVLYGRAPAWGLALPAIAAAYLAMTLESAYAHLRGRGGAWKGRIAHAMNGRCDGVSRCVRR